MFESLISETRHVFDLDFEIWIRRSRSKKEEIEFVQFGVLNIRSGSGLPQLLPLLKVPPGPPHHQHYHRDPRHPQK